MNLRRNLLCDTETLITLNSRCSSRRRLGLYRHHVFCGRAIHVDCNGHQSTRFHHNRVSDRGGTSSSQGRLQHCLKCAAGVWEAYVMNSETQPLLSKCRHQFSAYCKCRCFSSEIVRSFTAVVFTVQYTGAGGDTPNPNTTFVVIDYGNGEKSNPIPLVLDSSGNMTVNYTYSHADGAAQATLILYNEADSFSQTVNVRSIIIWTYHKWCGEER